MKKKFHKTKYLSGLLAAMLIFTLNLNAQDEQYTGNQGETIGTSDSRMVITIEETNEHVMLHVMGIGEILADGFGFSLIYQPDALVLTDNTFAYDVPLGLDPADLGSPVILMEPSFSDTYTTFQTQVMNHQAISSGAATSMRCLNTTVGTLSTQESDAIHFTSGKLVPVFTVFFRKKVVGTPLQTSDIGFYNNQSIPRAFSSWAYKGVSVTHGKASSSDFHYYKPDLFVYRSTSSLATLPASNIKKTSATLNGFIKRGDFAPQDDITVSGLASTTQTGKLDYDTIQQAGFIYSTTDVVMTANGITDKLTIDGTEYDFPSAAEIAAGTFTRGSETFYIILNYNTVPDQTQNYSENITELSEDTDYYFWSVIKYAFQTSGTYLNVGEKQSFSTCVPPDKPVSVASQAFCDGATVGDLAAFVESGLDLVWYDGQNVMLDPTDMLIDGEIYYAKASDNGCESDGVAVAVSIINGLAAPTVTSPQAFCSGALVSNLHAECSNILWYDTEVGGNLLHSNGILLDGKKYYASQATGGCESTIRSQVKVIISEDIVIDPPVIASPQKFDNGTLADILTDGSNITWYTALADGNQLPLATPLVNGVTYYAAYKSGTCESTTRTPVSIIIENSPVISPPVISSPQRFCEGAILQNISVPNNQIIWYASATGDTPLPVYTILAHDATYYAAQKTGYSESTDRVPVRILFDNLPGPEAPSPQIFCGSDEYTLADLEITGNGIVWYDAMIGGNLLPPSTALTTTPTPYYAANSAENCESARTGVIACAKDKPEVPVISGPISICKDEATFDLTTVVEKEVNITYTYFSDNTGSVIVQDPENVPLPSQNTTYYVRATDSSTGCESGLLAEINVVLSNPPVVSVTPAGAYTCINEFVILTITDNNTNWVADAKTATISDDNIASISLVNGELKVTGKATGITEIEYTSINVNRCTTKLIIPVEVTGSTIPLVDKTVNYNGNPQYIDSVYIQVGGVDKGEKSWITYSYADAGSNPTVGLPVNSGTYTVTADFAGSNEYCAATATATLTINKGAVSPPSLPQGLEAVYGNYLQDIPLPAGFRWVNPLTRVGNASPPLVQFFAFYNPDPANYEDYQVGLTVTIHPVIPAWPVFFPTADEVVYSPEQTLAAINLLNGSRDGSFSWRNPSTVPNVAQTKYEVVFTPYDIRNYDYSTEPGWDSESSTIIREVTLVVTPLPLEIYLTPGETATYTGFPLYISPATTNAPEGASPEISYHYHLEGEKMDAALYAGDYLILVFVNDPNYQGESEFVTFKVEKATTRIQVKEENQVFIGSPVVIDYKLLGSQTSPSLYWMLEFTYEGVNGTVYGPSKEAPDELGEYKVGISFPGDENHLPAKKETILKIVKGTSIGNTTVERFLIYPNPVDKNSRVVLDIPAAMFKDGDLLAEVYNANGVLLRKVIVTDTRIELQSESMEGTYFYVVRPKNGIPQTIKVIAK